MTLDEITALANSLSDPGDAYLSALCDEYTQPTQSVSARVNYYKFLYWLVLKRKPCVALELGVEFGIASAHMASAALEYGGRVIGIDRNFHHVPGCKVGEAYGNYDFIIGDTLAVPTVLRVTDFVAKYGPIGVVFQDSSHHYHQSVGEWDTYSQFLDNNAVWVCDDITSAFHDPKVDPPGSGMVQYFERLPGEKILFPDILHKGNTIGAVLI